MNTEYKLYAERDIMQLDKAGNYYCKHLMAMTAEGLHSKSDIAAELAYRDSVIAELEGQLANREVLCLPAEELKELIYSIHGSHHVGDAQHTKLDIINAQIDSLYANREPFVVKIPDYHYVLGCPCVWVDEIKAAITAAGGRCV